MEGARAGLGGPPQVCVLGACSGGGGGTHLVDAVDCTPPVAVSVQYLPVWVRKAHFLVSRSISSWKVSWSVSSS